MALDCRFKRDLPYVGDDTGNSGNPNKVGLDPRIIDREAIQRGHSSPWSSCKPDQSHSSQVY